MASRIDGLLDKLFPDELPTDNLPNLAAYKEDSTRTQLRLSLWLALITIANFGIWDVFGATGGVLTTRFRFLIACPIFVAFALASYTRWSNSHRNIFVLSFITAGIVITSIIVS
jgi:hypothetical protein